MLIDGEHHADTPLPDPPRIKVQERGSNDAAPLAKQPENRTSRATLSLRHSFTWGEGQGGTAGVSTKVLMIRSGRSNGK